MKRVKVFVEGATRGRGGNSSANIACRRAFAKLAERCGAINKPEFVHCGGRSHTWTAAWNEFLNRKEGEIILLLVDSEQPTSLPPEDAWKFLATQPSEPWKDLGERNARYVFLMVVMMETWLLADSAALARYFGIVFRTNQIPNWPSPEDIGKESILETMAKATQECQRQYEKGQTSFEALAEVDPKLIAQKCPHAAYFFQRLKEECA